MMSTLNPHPLWAASFTPLSRKCLSSLEDSIFFSFLSFLDIIFFAFASWQKKKSRDGRDWFHFMLVLLLYAVRLKPWRQLHENRKSDGWNSVMSSTDRVGEKSLRPEWSIHPSGTIIFNMQRCRWLRLQEASYYWKDEAGSKIIRV